MHPPSSPRTQRRGNAPDTGIAARLRKVVADIRDQGDVNLTRLTLLKKWFEAPGRLASFGVFIAHYASHRTQGKTPEAKALYQEARTLLADGTMFDPRIPRPAAMALHARLKDFQNEHRDMRWASVRVVHDLGLFLIEGGLELYLGRGISPTEGYRLAVAYCEHYDPRYGNGLNGPSVEGIEEIAGFVLAVEARERGGSGPIA